MTEVRKKVARVCEVNLLRKRVVFLSFDVAAPAVPAHRFGNTCKVALSHLRHRERANTPPVVVALAGDDCPENLLAIGLKVVETERVAIHLDTPHQQCDAYAQAEHVEQDVEAVARKIAQGKFEIVGQHVSYQLFVIGYQC